MDIQLTKYAGKAGSTPATTTRVSQVSIRTPSVISTPLPLHTAPAALVHLPHSCYQHVPESPPTVFDAQKAIRSKLQMVSIDIAMQSIKVSTEILHSQNTH